MDMGDNQASNLWKRRSEALQTLLQGFPVAARQTEIARQENEPSRQIANLFERFTENFATPLNRWAHENLHVQKRIDHVFYPFGGPDFCFPNALFPKARELVLVGNEPCGVWPPDTRLDAAALSSTVEGTLQAIRHYLSHSYFITKDLKQHLANPHVLGVLPLLLSQVLLSGFPIHSIASDSAKDGDRLVIEFGADDDIRRLYYYRRDLRDRHWAENSTLNEHLDRLAHLGVLLKSSSYLMHEAPFSHLRELILEKATLLVQDPSGVPYDLLRLWGWSVDLFGRFRSDIPVFSKYDQTSLARAYRNNPRSSSLGFGFGYLTDPDSAGLMVASPAGHAVHKRSAGR